MGDIANAGAIRATIDFDAAGLEAAVNKAMAKATSTISDQIDTSMKHVENRMSKGFKQVGGSILGYLGITDIVSGVGSAIGYINKLGDETERALNTFKAVSGATGAQMESVAQKANELGNDMELPGVSAGQAADAMVELAKAGFSVEESMGAAKGTLQLATAAQTDAGNAAQIAAAQIQAFQLKTSDAGHVADVLANAANITAADMQGMADSLNQAGAVAHASGLSFDETAAVIATMADNAIVGSDAGTSLKTMLIALQAPSAQAQALMKKYGIEVYDSTGHMKNLADITAEVSDGLKGASDKEKQFALATIFGTDALRAINVLMNTGAEGVAELTTQVGKAGAAQRLAAANAEGLTGSLGALQSTAESLAIEIYQNVGPAIDEWLRGRLEELPGVIDDARIYLSQLIDAGEPVAHLFANLAEAAEPGVWIALKAALGAVLGVMEGIGTVVRPLNALIDGNEAAFKALTSTLVSAAIAYKVMKVAINTGRTFRTNAIDSYRGSVDRLRGSFRGATSTIGRFRAAGAGVVGALGGPWGIALAAASLGVGYYAQKQAEAQAATDAMTGTLDEQTGALTENSRAQIIAGLGDQWLDYAESVGISADEIADAVTKGNGAVEDLVDGLAEQESRFSHLNPMNWTLDGTTLNTSKAAKFEEQMKEAVDAIHNARESFRRELEVNAAGKSGEAPLNPVDLLLGPVDKGSSKRIKELTDAAVGSWNAIPPFTDKVKENAGALDKQGKAAEAATRAIKGLNTEAISGVSAQVDFESALDDLKDQVKNVGGSLDIGSRKGQDFYRKLIAVANASAGVDGGMKRARKAIYDTIRPLTDSDAKARKLTDQFFKLKAQAEAVPNHVKVEVDANIQSARDKIAQIISQLNQIPRVKRTDYYVNQVNSISKPKVADEIHRAGGGAVYGRGTGTSDEIDAKLSNNEHVFTAAEVRAAGGHQNIIKLRKALLAGGMDAVGELGGGALVRELNVSVGDKRDLPEAMSSTLFHLRRIRRGGRYNR